eukprot:TRINITY_DN111132_c0_g1_i1.p1 TRINITY_DN111132_c0_g1~~TRINITY_DN111132_c0_g1_i1.p1  ORF type:complete len:670 (+),score=193.84 TRINITY_DN111132_c0_g1_i1:100-2010(+)
MAGVDEKTLLKEIRQCFDDEDFAKALPLCEQAPNSVVVQRCKAYALLQLSRWKPALEVCEKSQDKELAFEKAYCLYRLNQFQEALAALEQDEGDASRRMTLEAQVRYRMGDYKACAKMYEELYQEDRDESGLLVNAAASYISGDNAEQAVKVLRDEPELLDSSYELCFNLACALLDEGKLQEAEELLLNAKEICKKELMETEEEADAEKLEDHDELAAIQVQRAVVLQRKGELEEAQSVYEKWMKFKPGHEKDVTVMAVACNNYMGLKPSEKKSLSDSLVRVQLASKESLQHKLTSKQTMQIGINKALLLLKAGKKTEAVCEIKKLSTRMPNSEEVVVAEAAMAAAEGKNSACRQLLAKHLAAYPESDAARLALVTHYCTLNQHGKALEMLETLPIERRAQPLTLETLVLIHTRKKSMDKALEVLKEAVKYWGDADLDEEELSKVLRVAARLATALNDQALCAEIYRLYLEKVDGSDTEALVCLVDALAFADLERAEQYTDRLKLPDYGHLDAEELEQQSIPKIMTAVSKKSEGTAAVEASDVDQPKKKKRKSRKPLPKNYDPNATPDPERWLPKRERTETKKKNQKKQKNYLRCAQGADAPDDASSFKKGPSTAQVEVAKDTTTGRSRNQGRRKK